MDRGQERESVRICELFFSCLHLLSENKLVEALGAALDSGLPEREVAAVFSWVRGTHPVRTRAPWKEDR
jgi:hypothetical protein